MITDSIINSEFYYSLNRNFKSAFEWIKSTDLLKLEKGKIEIQGEEIFAIVNDYKTVDSSVSKLEAHQRYIDLQFVIEGKEMMGYIAKNNQTPFKEYDQEGDYALYVDSNTVLLPFEENSFFLLFPQDLHMPGIHYFGREEQVKKLVLKIAV